MLQKIKNLFKSTCEDELKQLEMNVKELVDEVVSLRVKLEEKQEQINKTNSYYKKKLYNMKLKLKGEK